MEDWLKKQIVEAHTLLTAMGVPDREYKTDPRTGEENKPFSLGVPDRIKWLRRHWAPTARMGDTSKQGKW